MSFCKGTPLVVLGVLVLLVGSVSCDSTDDGMTRAKADAAVQAGSEDAALSRIAIPPGHGPFVDADIAGRCGNPRTGFAPPTGGLLSSESSPTFYVSDLRRGYGHVRIAVLAYKNPARAKTAFEKLGTTAFEDCLVAATNSWLDKAGGAYTSVPVPTVDEFETTSAPVVAGDQATLTETMFYEDVLGGYDNAHNAALFVARSGPLLISAIAASNDQRADPENSAALARSLGIAALARATAG